MGTKMEKQLQYTSVGFKSPTKNNFHQTKTYTFFNPVVSGHFSVSVAPRCSQRLSRSAVRPLRAAGGRLGGRGLQCGAAFGFGRHGEPAEAPGAAEQCPLQKKMWGENGIERGDSIL